jgi:beta-ureidopropionase
MKQKKTERPKLCCDSYIAVAMQPRVYGCRNKDDVKLNMDNQINLIEDSMHTSFLCGGGPLKLITFPEGAIQGMYDETSNMDQATFCRDVALTIPGEETDRLAEVAQKYGVYIAAQAKVIDPDIMEDRYFNVGFIISPSGDIILKHTKNIISVIEGTTSPYDIWDRWVEKYGDSLESYYPVVKTDIGNLAIAICAETFFPETFRAFNLLGAEVVIKPTMAQPLIMSGYWEFTNRTRAVDNICYIVAPNYASYYRHPGMGATNGKGGGNSMIIDYRGNIVMKSDQATEATIPGEINIKGLRSYRISSPHGLMMSQMRTGLWKQIYERWPDYPKNLYMERTYANKLERNELHSHTQQLLENGIYENPFK